VARVAAATAVAASEAPADGSGSDHCTACTPPALLRLTTMPTSARACASIWPLPRRRSLA